MPAAGVLHGIVRSTADEDSWLAELGAPHLDAPAAGPAGQWEADALPATGNWDEWNEFLVRAYPYVLPTSLLCAGLGNSSHLLIRPLWRHARALSAAALDRGASWLMNTWC